MNNLRIIIEDGIVDFYEIQKIRQKEDSVKRLLASSVASKMGIFMR